MKLAISYALNIPKHQIHRKIPSQKPWWMNFIHLMKFSDRNWLKVLWPSMWWVRYLRIPNSMVIFLTDQWINQWVIGEVYNIIIYTLYILDWFAGKWTAAFFVLMIFHKKTADKRDKPQNEPTRPTWPTWHFWMVCHETSWQLQSPGHMMCVNGVTLISFGNVVMEPASFAPVFAGGELAKTQKKKNVEKTSEIDGCW